MDKVQTLRLSQVTGILHKTAKALIQTQGYYTCHMDGQKIRIILSQQDFYSLPEVVEQLNIQKSNRYGSEAHKSAFHEIGNIAKKYGVFDDYAKSGGGMDY